MKDSESAPQTGLEKQARMRLGAAGAAQQLCHLW